ncbi:MAG: putative nucleic acid-binding Zn-ribbon protein [Halieaceae bacterium]|jgi:predicted  nucleic acid-binding Zn-ribbon protein
MTTKDKYVAKMKSEIDDMDAQLDKLAAKSKSAKKDMEAKYKQDMADLRAQSSKASAQLDELKAAGEDTWESMVAEMDKMGDAFKHSYNYFKTQL